MRTLRDASNDADWLRDLDSKWHIMETQKWGYAEFAEIVCTSCLCRCICSLLLNHEGDHICDCEGSWDKDGIPVGLPRVVVEDGGPFPKGFRFFDEPALLDKAADGG